MLIIILVVVVRVVVIVVIVFVILIVVVVIVVFVFLLFLVLMVAPPPLVVVPVPAGVLLLVLRGELQLGHEAVVVERWEELPRTVCRRNRERKTDGDESDIMLNEQQQHLNSTRMFSSPLKTRDCDWRKPQSRWYRGSLFVVPRYTET